MISAIINYGQDHDVGGMRLSFIVASCFSQLQIERLVNLNNIGSFGEIGIYLEATTKEKIYIVVLNCG